MQWVSWKWPTDKTTYEGIGDNGTCHGLGTAKFPDGSRFEGEWQDGKPKGFGVLTWKDGSSYAGEWHKNMMQGCGSFKTATGQLSEGQFVANKFVGPGLSCPIEASEFARDEAQDAARRAQRFSLDPKWMRS